MIRSASATSASHWVPQQRHLPRRRAARDRGLGRGNLGPLWLRRLDSELGRRARSARSGPRSVSAARQQPLGRPEDRHPGARRGRPVDAAATGLDLCLSPWDRDRRHLMILGGWRRRVWDRGPAAALERGRRRAARRRRASAATAPTPIAPSPSRRRGRRGARAGARIGFGPMASLTIFSGIQPDRRQAPRQLHRGDPPLRRGPGSRRSGDLLHRRPARDLRSPMTRPSCASGSMTPTAMLLAAGLDPDRSILFRQIRRARAHRADLAALRGHPPRRSQPHDPVQGEVGAPARAGLGGALHLPGADGRRRARLPGRPRSRSATTSASMSS